MDTAHNVAQQLVDQLSRQDLRIVFAESCTAGLVAATMGRIPGVSNYLCGSAVTYRSETKVAWLGVAQDVLSQHTAVSAPVTEAMARNVLTRTPEAAIAVTVTGHLGPEAPPELDGVVFVCVAIRTTDSVTTKKLCLQAHDRVSRQQEAALVTLQMALTTIS